MDLTYVIPGAVLMAIALYFAITWRQQAEWIRRWYASMSREDGRPWWSRGLFRPNFRQSGIIAWLYITAFAIFAAYLLARGFGVD